MSKRLLMRVGVLTVATVFALSGCFIIIGDWDLSNWTADLHIVGEWDVDFGNLDLYLSYPDPVDGNTTDDTFVPTFSDPYYDYSTVAGGDNGFYIEDYDIDPALRELVYTGSKTSSFTADGAASVEMTVDSTQDGEEVIIVRRPPFNYTVVDPGDFQGANAEIGLPTSRDDYAWIGVSELYVNASGGNIAAADLEVTIYDANDNPLISFRPSENASYASASIARIHYFRAKNSGETDTEPYYLIVPDQRWITNGTDGFRSVTGTTSDGETFVGAFGRAETE